jgi:hypothetical protein
MVNLSATGRGFKRQSIANTVYRWENEDGCIVLLVERGALYVKNDQQLTYSKPNE